MAEYCANTSAPWRIRVLTKHLAQFISGAWAIQPLACLADAPPKASSAEPTFGVSAMWLLLDGHDLETRDWAFDFMAKSDLFVSRRVGEKVFASPDFNEPMDTLREKTFKCILFLASKGAFKLQAIVNHL